LAENQENEGEIEPRAPDRADDEQLEAFPLTDHELVAAYEAHSGPLPNRQWFAGVERLHQGATAEIIKDYTDERQHQRVMQQKALEVDQSSLDAFAAYQLTRLRIVGSLAALIAIAGVALIFADKPLAGFVLLIGEIAGMVLAFFGRRKEVDDGAEDPDSEIGPI
jgi:hypothetical protein